MQRPHIPERNVVNQLAFSQFALRELTGDIARVIQDILNYGKRQEGLARVDRSLIKHFGCLVNSLDAFHGTDIAGALGTEHWYRSANLHHFLLLELIKLGSAQGKHARRLEVLLSSVLFMFIKANVLNAEDAFGSKFAYILFKQNTFKLYAHLLAAWSNGPPDSLECKLRLMAQFSLIFSSCAQLTISDQPLTPADTTSTDLYAACLEALSSSLLLEHMAKALLKALNVSSDAAGVGQLTPEQKRSIQVGVMETCGCIISALHGIAGKQSVLDSCCLGDRDRLMPVEGVAQQLVLQVREVLSGHCLQFLLGREVIASRLRLTAGDGPRYGLPDCMLPELIVPNNNPSRSRALTDRLLSRLSAASLVWHLTMRIRLQPEKSMEPYAPVNIFDMVLDALSNVAKETPVEHLPGGSQMTLMEPAMLCVRLTLQLHPRHLQPRLEGLWQVLITLLRRPNLRLQYSEHRPLQLIGGLLRLDLHVREHFSGWGAAAAAAHRGGEAAAADASEAAADAFCFNLRCAIKAGFIPAVEQLLRGWGRDAEPAKGERSCLCTMDHLLRLPGVWMALLAHGSVREMASLIVTIRRLAEVFKDRGLALMTESGNNDPNEHQDAEVVITAYMAALLEQQAVVLLPSVEGVKPLVLNKALGSGGLPVVEEAVAQLAGQPAEQQWVLAMFALSQWLPNAAWLARVVDTWFSIDMGKTVLYWVLHVALQCLVALARSQAEWAEEQARMSPSAGELGSCEANDGEASGRSDEASHGEGAGTSASAHFATSRQCGPATMAYMAWATFLMVGMDIFAWVNKYLAQLRELDEQQHQREGEGEKRKTSDFAEQPEQDSARRKNEGEISGGLSPKALLPEVFDVLEVLALAAPRTMQTCLTSTVANAQPYGFVNCSDETSASSTSPATTARSNHDRVILVDDWLRNLLCNNDRSILLSVIEEWAKENRRSGIWCPGAISQSPGLAPGEETLQFLELKSLVLRKHNVARLPDLPSPHAVAEMVEAAGIKLCANPACMNLEKDSEVELSGCKTCARCKLVSYCSSKCQLEHWMNQHKRDCPGALQWQESGKAA
ncbi:hypothetical protein Vretimale_8273 [Volvox reticuliferus]|uniref:phytol kinase n=1 Tax=Volvox reticuliferus TaxID=1737510 RepID=A0A8J4GB74_9CHLO|nr:hypothetical protein Vretimale_8273 [Volvox reticuliferus]